MQTPRQRQISVALQLAVVAMVAMLLLVSGYLKFDDARSRQADSASMPALTFTSPTGAASAGAIP